jgi:hypothetical protein
VLFVEQFKNKNMSKQTAVDYLVKELSAILGPLETKPMQDLLMVDAINKAKQMEKEQLISFGYTQIQYVDAEIGDCVYKKVPEEIYNETYGQS